MPKKKVSNSWGNDGASDATCGNNRERLAWIVCIAVAWAFVFAMTFVPETVEYTDMERLRLGLFTAAIGLMAFGIGMKVGQDRK